MTKKITREEWLVRGAKMLAKGVFKGQEVPAIRVSVGFPKGSRGKAVGQCWSDTVSSDGTAEIFISPTIDEPVRALDILCHEMVHAIVGIDAGHKGPFAKLARAIGLEGKLTATEAGADLREKLETAVDMLGEFPHAAMTPGSKTTKQGTRLIKCECEECGYTVRTTQKWLDVGVPHCPEHGEMTVA